MSIEPELSIVVSFLCFAWIFAKKVYPAVVKQLDDHIDSVKAKIHEAERLKDEANSALKNAYVKKRDIETIIQENQKKSEEKIARLREENEILLQTLRKRYEDTLKSQLEADFMKQKNELIKRLSDLLIEKLTEKIKSSPTNDVTISREELEKLL